MTKEQKIEILKKVEGDFFGGCTLKAVSDGKEYTDSGLDMAYWLECIEAKADEEGYDTDDEQTLKTLAEEELRAEFIA